MAEEYNILNPTTPSEGGGEIPDSATDAVQIVADNINAVIEVASYIDPDGNFNVEAIEGNNTEIRVLRKTGAGWAANDIILGEGELGYVLDAGAQKILKIGDGTNPFSLLPNVLPITSFEPEDLQPYVDDCETAQTAAETASTEADTSRSTAVSAANEASASAQLAGDWAAAPSTTPLPGGKKSAAAYADIASAVASTSRLIQRATCAGSETLTAGMLFTKRLHNDAALATITIPPDLFTHANDVEAWMLYRKEGAGNIKFAASGSGTGLAAPQLKGSGHDSYRNKTLSATNSLVATFSFPVPAITDGKLALIIGAGFSASGERDLTITSTGSLTFTNRRAASVSTVTNDLCYAVFDADLDAFTAKTIDIAVSGYPNINQLQFYWFAIEGHGGEMLLPVTALTAAAAAANISLTLAALAAQSLVCAAANQVGKESSVAFSSFSNVLLLSSGVTSGAPDITIPDTTDLKNTAWGQAAGAASATADFLVQANFSAAYRKPSLCLIAYPPKTVAGAGLVNLHFMGGRDTLNVLYGEAQLLFAPNGKDVTVIIPAA
jgi:hypothetical protein